MTQHITQEQATQIAAQLAEDAAYEFNIANAAIQHYLDQHKAELPEPVAWLANYGGNVYTEAQLKQAVRDAYEDAAKVCEKQDGVHDVIYAAAIRALIKEIPE